MRRREFITLVVSATAALQQVADAQQAERLRHIGVLMAIGGDDPEAPLRTAAFTHGLQELGWTDGRNMRIDYRWAGGNAEKARQYSVELCEDPAMAPTPDTSNRFVLEVFDRTLWCPTAQAPFTRAMLVRFGRSSAWGPRTTPSY